MRSLCHYFSKAKVYYAEGSIQQLENIQKRAVHYFNMIKSYIVQSQPLAEGSSLEETVQKPIPGEAIPKVS